MTDLSTRYLGLSLSTPLVVSASPLSQDVAQLAKMAFLGAGAVVLQSLFAEQLTAEHEGRTAVAPRGAEGAPAAATPLPDMAGYNFGPKGYLELATCKVSSQLLRVLKLVHYRRDAPPLLGDGHGWHR
jgi:dihydroorotate dehydrogenase (fumarate)